MITKQEVFVDASKRVLARSSDMDGLDAECALNDALNFLKDQGYRIVLPEKRGYRETLNGREAIVIESEL